MTVPAELRAHHLLCLHFFSGEGYSADFVANLHRVVAAAEDDGVTIVEGADSVCARCPGLDGTVCESEAEIGRLDELALRLLSVEPGEVVVWAEVRDRLPDVLEAWYAGACDGCDWLAVCTHSGLCELCDTAASQAAAELP
jgi:uncharacterized protein